MEEKEEKYEQLGLGCSSMGGKPLLSSWLESSLESSTGAALLNLVLPKPWGSCCFGCREHLPLFSLGNAALSSCLLSSC